MAEIDVLKVEHAFPRPKKTFIRYLLRFSDIDVRYYTFKLLTAETMPPEVVI